MRIKLVFFLFLGLLVLSGAWIAFRNISANKEQISRFEKIPLISLLSLDGTEVLLPDLILEKPNVLIYFNSSCPICQSEAELLVREYSQDSSVNFIWISSEPLVAVDEFRDRFGLDILPNYVLASDTLFKFANEFKLTSVPSTLVYDGQGRFIDFFKRAVSMQELKTAIQRADEGVR